MRSGFLDTARPRALGGAVLILALTATGPATASSFPTKPVRIIVHSSPGGQLDVTTRLVAQEMTAILGQPVIVENRPGADGLVGIRYVKASAPDGYTLLAAGVTLAIQPAIKLDPGYDLVKDFTAIGPMVSIPFVMLTGVDQPDKNLADFIERAKENPGKMSYASAGYGTATHLAAASFLKQAGVKLLHVPYKGNAPGMVEVAAGRVNIIFDAYGSSSALIKAGRLKALGVTSETRVSPLPNVPTLAEQSVRNYSYEPWLGLVAPAGTPKDVVQRLAAALKAVLTNKQVAARFRNDGAEPMLMSPHAFNERLKQDFTQASRLVIELGLPKE